MGNRLKAEHDFFDFAVSGGAGAADEASYQALLSAADRRALAAGTGSVRGIVPPNFPGAEGVEQLRMRVLSSKDQIAASPSATTRTRTMHGPTATPTV